jgi:hypothetical protein
MQNINSKNTLMKKILYLLSVLFLISCHGQNCETVPSSFKSPEKALAIVGKASFSFHESINTSKSSWISGLSFYSCNNITGFLIMETESNKYIHQEVPVSLWQKLKNSPSFGTFYNYNIKGKYKVRL